MFQTTNQIQYTMVTIEHKFWDLGSLVASAGHRFVAFQLAGRNLFDASRT